MNRYFESGRFPIRVGWATALCGLASCAVLSCGVLPPAARLAAAEPDPKAAEKAAKEQAEAQRRQQIDQHAKNFEPALAGFMEGELELVRKTCGSLPPPARREILAAGKKAVTSASQHFAAWQIGGQQGKPVEPKRTVQEAVHEAVKPHATADEFAAYERALAARLIRRDRAARAVIVANLDHGLRLSIAQRDAIAADLEKAWQDAWRAILADHGFNNNGRGPAPDFADRCIAPHLDPRQQTAWKTWREQVGWTQIAPQFANQFHSFGIPLEPDPWWNP